MIKDEKICVVGLGYIGLLAIVLAKAGLQVLGVDSNKLVINSLKSGTAHFYEPEIQEQFDSVTIRNPIKYSIHLENSDYFIVCVPTPLVEINNRLSPDLSFVFDAIDSICPLLRKGNTIIIESTIPVGTTKRVAKKLIGYGFKKGDINIVHCPERVLPGNIFKELKDNARVIGGNTNKDNKRQEFYMMFLSRVKLWRLIVIQQSFVNWWKIAIET